MKWDLAAVADATGGRFDGSAAVTNVSVDSRRCRSGSLFVALRGESADGHGYIEEAVAAGATAILVEEGRLPPGIPGVEVKDTLAALRSLAESRRTQIAVPVIAITGSNGKTSTKDLLVGALGPGAHGAPRSFNNEVGVPLTVLGAPDDATALVIEVGSRGRGHIELLAPAIRPDVAIITNIGRAHLETFGDVDGVVAAKWELIEALPPTGIAVLPTADEHLTGRRSGPMLTFGDDPGSDVLVRNVSMSEEATATFEIAHGDEVSPMILRMAGRHQPMNAAAAIAGAIAVGRPFEEAVRGAADTRGPEWRMEVNRGPITVVNDAYNANPDSTVEALATVAGMPGRHIAVLGKMHELGDWAAAGHREVGRAAADLGFATVVVVGDDPGIAAGAGAVAQHATDIEEAASLLEGILAEGDVVLVKASRAEGLERLAARLIGIRP